MCKCSNCNKEAQLNKLIKQVKEQESMLRQLFQQMEQQQELVNDVLLETRKGLQPPPSFSILEKLDTEKLAQIAAFIGSLYSNNSNEDQDQEQESTLKQLYSQMEQQQELLNRVLRGTGLLPPQPSFSILEKLDIEKLAQIAAFIGSLFTNDSEEAEDQ
ncbi:MULTISPECIES: hypothetical protein [Metabacillus]|uniref:Uncharacterized protein n=2 Tax=Metabacillus TaxID=2675233 RepID=A0A179T015_9BACI|nr:MULTISPECIES: hypothetical protein [Metabacillus]OAS85892.1 hypothetical protein A6K24_23165 [Metabacillus litoralis]QNF30081.1 hypothetical protein HUW50_22970 [Metabacillus sp. KUDC1714]